MIGALLKIFLNAVLERQNKNFLQTVLPTKKHAYLLVWEILKWVKSSSNLQWIKHFSEKPAKQTKKRLAENVFFLILFQLFEFLLHVQNGFDCYFSCVVTELDSENNQYKVIESFRNEF